jgi:hypothetical protein
MVRVLAGGVAMLPAPSATLCSSAKFSTLHDVTRTFGCVLSLLLLIAVASAQPRVDLVIVKKKEHKLLLMNGDTVVKSYSIALARGGLGPKQRETTRRRKGPIASTQEISRAGSTVRYMSRTQTKQIKSEHRNWVLIPEATS